MVISVYPVKISLLAIVGNRWSIQFSSVRQNANALKLRSLHSSMLIINVFKASAF